MTTYHVSSCSMWAMREGKLADLRGFKLVSYAGGRASFPTESDFIATREEADRLCAIANAGGDTGLKFASYADD